MFAQSHIPAPGSANKSLALHQSPFKNVTSATHRDFISAVAQHPFLLCLHGGGADPSPKAWEAVLTGAFRNLPSVMRSLFNARQFLFCSAGTIPIIEHSALDDAYSQLPVAFVRNITEFMLWDNKTAVMKQW